MRSELANLIRNATLLGPGTTHSEFRSPASELRCRSEEQSPASQAFILLQYDDSHVGTHQYASCSIFPASNDLSSHELCMGCNSYYQKISTSSMDWHKSKVLVAAIDLSND